MSLFGRLTRSVKSLFTFSASERRGIILLLPLLAVIAVVITLANRSRSGNDFLDLVDAKLENTETDTAVRYGLSGKTENDPEATGAESPISSGGRAGELFEFDPNTATLQEFVRLGLSARVAASVIKYRERGKVFEIPEDFAACYGLDIEQYTRLEPYIRIGGRYRLKHAERFPQTGSAANSTGGDAGGSIQGAEQPDMPSVVAGGISVEKFNPNELTAGGFVTLGFSPAQADVIVRYRDRIGGFRTPEDFARCYVVSQRMMETLSPYISIPTGGIQMPKVKELLEINRADSASLRGISGIGSVLVVRIMEYREKLGGFAKKEQLAEIKGMTEENYDRIISQIYVDSCEIRKIDINFADHKSLVECLENHPYMDAATLRKILKYRQLKGGWSTIEDMAGQNILTHSQAGKLAPYFVFGAYRQQL